ncbi:MAG: RnfH family protein [Azospira sp.]|jgi:putative ubiquitin-RnfH superfamily antitoxin RatB of RatAB toxin-antitoxin module|nr:RnfH family protein [Azospira sp.]
MKIEVIYALPHAAERVEIELPEGSTVLQAVEASGILAKHPEIDPGKTRYGIYAKPAKADTVLRELDRVEIYRPLIADPKEVRRQRAAEGKAMKKGAGDEAGAAG